MMDMHCHVDLYPQHQKVLDDIERSNYYVLSVTTVPSAFEGTVNLTKGLKHCKTALGLHPQLAHLRKNELPVFDRLIEKTKYIGEIGLDGSKGWREHFDDQLMVFNHILKKCESFDDKVLTIHSLNAVDETLLCLKEHPNAGTPILHWFLGTKKQLLEAVELGCYFSVGPAMLASARGKRIVSWIPRQKMLLETDGPFAKVLGKVLFPSDVDRVIQHLSDEWSISCSDVVGQLTKNLRQLVATSE
ncbi:TatD family hydrolase [Photobacterium sp. WH77]|uniref:Qat anti-phage system TatD family nuclease QatD n=1 Tax=unclassified Photobacterium TaxID=2628852 RepID=UPI001EDAB02C|nr:MULTISPECIES: Qat anti-phage system TatD family nuclease QatD [unclassified Photobacterium]MCG2838295.1 TatD family hydrolase [Photobacterium sp. WH77]MCG2845990.1 TatD family hydrolase [Photobacterium sp. WH80]